MSHGVRVLYFRSNFSSSPNTVGNYTNTIVRDNYIYGGFATDTQDASTDTKGTNKEDAIIKSVAESFSFSSVCSISSCAGSVLQLVLELGLVISTSRTSVLLAQS